MTVGPLDRIAPMKAVVDVLPADDGAWATELKWDGMRVLVHAANDKIIMRSASGRDTTAAFPELHELGDVVPPGTVLDGEAVVMVDGVPSFRALQHRIHVAKPSPALLAQYPVQIVVFDLLWYDGHNIMALPFRTRRAALDQALDNGRAWSLSMLTSGSPASLFDLASERNLEGVVCKRVDSPYVPGRSAHWRKIKVRPRTDMVIGGWIGGSGTLAGRIGSVVVGVADGTGFRCTGAVGSGITDADRARMSAAFVKRDSSPFHNPELMTARISDRINWVEPELVAEIGYARWDQDHALWQPTFHGLRADADPLATEYRQ
ncbi:MAG: ATP-dependent DNA ligase [Acidimicrobiales bacterium]